jgi:hypothetical protein
MAHSLSKEFSLAMQAPLDMGFQGNIFRKQSDSRVGPLWLLASFVSWVNLLNSPAH